MSMPYDKNSVVTPLLYSLDNPINKKSQGRDQNNGSSKNSILRKISGQKLTNLKKIAMLPKAYLLKNRIIKSKIIMINPALTKITNYYNNLANISKLSTNSEIIVQLKKKDLCLHELEIGSPDSASSPILSKPTNLLTVQINNNTATQVNNNIDLSHIESLSDNDHFTKTIKQIAKSINEKNITKNQIQIKQQKLNELRISKLRRRLELRNYLKSLYTFKSDLAFNKQIIYKFSNKMSSALSEQNCPPVREGGVDIKNLYYILKNSFLTFYCIISKPILEFTPNKLKIKLFYFNTSPTGKNFSLLGEKKYMLKELEYLCNKLSKIMKTSVVLDLVELQSYQLEGNILANSIGIITDKLGKNFRRTVNKIFKNTIIINPDKMKYIQNKMSIKSGNKAIAFFTGINIRLAGRLSKQSIVPRKTVKTIQKGSLARRHTDFLTISKYTAKNRRGIFCYTITIGHKYY